MSENDFLDITTATEQQGSYIKVIGVGGAGTNAVNHMYNRGITGVDFIVCNTDEQSLNSSPITTKIKIGEGGLGAGNKPEVAQKAAIAASDRIKSVLDSNTHMLFITAGMGGGTGTGASPEIAKIAKEIEIDGGNNEILVVAVVTIPFSFEGRKRREQARIGIENLKKTVDSIIIVNTDKLKSRGNMSMKNAFALADDVLFTAAKGISEIMTANAYIHVDFRDVQSIMQHSGVALMGSGTGEGEDRAYEAIKAATTSDLLNDNDLKQTQNILLYISYSSKEEYQLQTDELETITNYIQEITNADVDMIWGCGTDDTLEGKVSITLVATGFESQEIYHTPERSISAGVKAPVAQEPVTQVLNIAQESANEIKQQPVQPAVHQPVVTDNNTQTSAQYNKVISDTDFTVTKKEEPASQFSSVKEKESEVVTITLGEDNPYAKHEETKQEKQPVTEDKDDIMAQFAKADTVKQTFVLDIKETETDSMAEEEYKNES
ncbi:MAG: cell division protein FtsZ, partial [Bacteroidales bacterium]|nr:cell division protein FtsZ [Bacteroidales bacterium]